MVPELTHLSKIGLVFVGELPQPIFDDVGWRHFTKPNMNKHFFHCCDGMSSVVYHLLLYSLDTELDEGFFLITKSGVNKNQMG